MIHVLRLIFAAIFLTLTTPTLIDANEGTTISNFTQVGINPINNCVSFSVASGTGCAWMCNYCANSLGTFNYYFTDNVCVYQTGGCVGSPLAGTVYTCCSM